MILKDWKNMKKQSVLEFKNFNWISADDPPLPYQDNEHFSYPVLAYDENLNAYEICKVLYTKVSGVMYHSWQCVKINPTHWIPIEY